MRHRVEFDVVDVTREPPCARTRRGLGYVPQGREIFPGLSVRDNLRMGFAGRGAYERIDTILDTFPRLTPLLNRRDGAISGVEQQLLAIARCLAGRPRMILFDEPTEGIQPSIIEELTVMLRRLHQREGSRSSSSGRIWNSLPSWPGGCCSSRRARSCVNWSQRNSVTPTC